MPELGRWNCIDPLTDHPNQIGKSPYAYAWNNPVALTDQDGECPICPFLIKGASAAAIDYMLQGAVNYAGGMNVRDAFSTGNIDMVSVGLSGLEGMNPFNAPGGKYGKAAAAAFSSAATGYITALAEDREYTDGDFAQDFLIGFAAELGAEKVADFFGNRSPTTLNLKGGGTSSADRVFYSANDNPQVYAQAKAFAEENGLVMIDMTRAHGNLEKLQEGLPFSEATMNQWRKLSEAYAGGTGTRAYFFGNADGLSPNSVWLLNEKPILDANGVDIVTTLVENE